MVGHRYYNPEWGRWIQPDDIEYLDPTNINGLNLYAYCGNDPVNMYDPDGHSAIAIILAIVGVVASGVFTGIGAMAGKTEEESNLGAFVGGFIDGAVGAIAVAAGIATGGWGGLLITAGISFAGGFTGNIVGQVISYGDFQYLPAFAQGAASTITNSVIFAGTFVSGFIDAATGMERFIETLGISPLGFGISAYFTYLSFPSFNKLRR